MCYITFMSGYMCYTTCILFDYYLSLIHVNIKIEFIVNVFQLKSLKKTMIAWLTHWKNPDWQHQLKKKVRVLCLSYCFMCNISYSVVMLLGCVKL